MQPLNISMQAKLAEVYFGFKKIEEIIQIYKESRENADQTFQLVYGKADSLTNKFGTNEKKNTFLWTVDKSE